MRNEHPPHPATRLMARETVALAIECSVPRVVTFAIYAATHTGDVSAAEAEADALEALLLPRVPPAREVRTVRYVGAGEVALGEPGPTLRRLLDDARARRFLAVLVRSHEAMGLTAARRSDVLRDLGASMVQVMTAAQVAGWPVRRALSGVR